MASRILSMPSVTSTNHANKHHSQTATVSNGGVNLMMSSSSSSSNSSSFSDTCERPNAFYHLINQSSTSTSTGCHNFTNAKWNIGLVNSEGKYLTAESFGFKLNASGNTLRKKQKWSLEQCDTDECVYLISPLGNYLCSDKYGRLTCDTPSSQSPECKFHLETSLIDGKWAFRSAIHNYYLGGTGDKLHCFSKTPEYWTVHLGIHPQINLRHALRKRYARLDEDEMHVDELIPWGSDCLVTIEFREERYAIRTSNGMYLNRDGKLVALPSEDTLFSVEFHRGCVAFRHKTGKYLTAVGPQGIVTARSKCVTKDELFMFESNHAQVSLIAHNGKLVSTKQGLDVSANQIELANTETFQLEQDLSNEKWAFRTNANKYWKLENNNGIQSTGDLNHPNIYFDMIWLKAGHVALRAANGKFVSAAATGHMRAISDLVTDLEVFRLSLVNRPILVLKCEYGLVGYKNKTNFKLECNKSTFNVIMLEESNDLNGFYYLKGSHGLYWDIGADNTLSTNSTLPSKFSLELLPNNRMLIKGPNGCYIKGEQSGSLTSIVTDPKFATQWEF